VADTIGDDVRGVCRRGWDVPVIPIPTSGFLGGAFHEGLENALIALSALAGPGDGTRNGIAIVGERNLEYDVEENYKEVKRLLVLLGIPVDIRFVRGITTEEIARLGSCTGAVLRDRALCRVGDHLQGKYALPCIASFPAGLSGSLDFIREVGNVTGVVTSGAIREENRLHEELHRDFADLRTACISLESGSMSWADDLAASLGINLTPEGVPVPCPADPPVGLSGTRRLLHRWRSVINA
jgi:nitrogenase molybdenum-iron protein alpha/beta subunit